MTCVVSDGNLASSDSNLASSDLPQSTFYEDISSEDSEEDSVSTAFSTTVLAADRLIGQGVLLNDQELDATKLMHIIFECNRSQYRTARR